MNAVDYRKATKKKDEDKYTPHSKNSKKKMKEMLDDIAHISVQDVIYKPPKKSPKKKENRILIEKSTQRTYDDEKPNKDNKPLLIDYIMQEINKINDLDYL